MTVPGDLPCSDVMVGGVVPPPCIIIMWQGKLLWVELKTNGGVIYITTLIHFHYFISLETANTQICEVFLLRISLGNVNASVVTY